MPSPERPKHRPDSNEKANKQTEKQESKEARPPKSERAAMVIMNEAFKAADKRSKELLADHKSEILDDLSEKLEEMGEFTREQAADVLKDILETYEKSSSNEESDGSAENFSFEDFKTDHVRPKEGQEQPSEAERFIEQTIPTALLKDLSESDRTSLAQEISGRLEVAAQGVESGQASANEEVKNIRDLALERMLVKIDDENIASQIETMLGHDEEEEAETEAGLELVEGMENKEIAQEFLENVASAQGIDADITPDLADHFIRSYSVQANSALERLKTGLSEDNEKMQDKAMQQIKDLAESYFKQKYDQFKQAA
jgi:hypothetical protein